MFSVRGRDDQCLVTKGKLREDREIAMQKVDFFKFWGASPPRI